MKTLRRKHYIRLITAATIISLPIHTTTANSAEPQVNGLTNSLSPYLRQHAHNPVNWYPWGSDAIQKAKQENKPILLSIGYLTCYWCHVLEREVFTQKDAAQVMNDNFINIKVDREVSPEIDRIYMAATQLMIKNGGWPNNIILNHDLKPFATTTYLPKKQWIMFTKEVSNAWKTKKDLVTIQSDQVTESIKRLFENKEPLTITIPIKDIAQDLYEHKATTFDNRNGGFGTGVKFPQETSLLFLLRHGQDKKTKEPTNMVKTTVDNILRGAIHDRVGGGFHRYSSDAKWLTPHFEKMLYNQALMALVLSRLYEETNELRYKKHLVRVLNYIEREMTDESGAFYSAQDAETNAVEGAYYVWNNEELTSTLTLEEHETLSLSHRINELPQFQGHNHPDGGALYQSKNLTNETEEKTLDIILNKLLSAREKRDAPLLDHKIITSWNGMMIYALANSARTTGDVEYLKQAEKAANFILKNMQQQNGKLYRINVDGQSFQEAFLEDYAWLGRGLMAVYHGTGKNEYKTAALKLISIADTYLLDKKTNAYFMSDNSLKLPVRITTADDSGSLPSGNSVIAHLFVDLYKDTNNEKWKNRIKNLTTAFGQSIINDPNKHSHLIHALSRVEVFNSTKSIPETTDNPFTHAISSKDKVYISAKIIETGSTSKQKNIAVTIDIEDGWHINANPASLDFLIPTTVDIQTDKTSDIEIDYPTPYKIETPLGALYSYKGAVNINASISSQETIETKKMRALVQVQACKNDICYPPSQITTNITE
ncbi:MAG: DUF255 domain-containing protein [Alphaproteobacteria bacterium]